MPGNDRAGAGRSLPGSDTGARRGRGGEERSGEQRNRGVGVVLRDARAGFVNAVF